MPSANIYLVGREFFRVEKETHAECKCLSSRESFSE
jgi:hypothetical protein